MFPIVAQATQPQADEADTQHFTVGLLDGAAKGWSFGAGITTLMLCITSSAYAVKGARGVEPDVQKTFVELLPSNIDAQRNRPPAPSDAKSSLGEASGQQVATGSQLDILENRDALDTPFNVTAYTSKYIANSLASSITDVTAGDPSIRGIFQKTSYPDVYSIRGFNSFSYNMGLNGLYGIKQR